MCPRHHAKLIFCIILLNLTAGEETEAQAATCPVSLMVDVPHGWVQRVLRVRGGARRVGWGRAQD